MASDIGSPLPSKAEGPRDSTYLIPTADSGERKALRYNPWYMSWLVVLGTPLVLLSLGIALETGTLISSKNGGFRVPPTNVFPLVSPQFLLSFVPTLIVIPFAIMWREIDWSVRWLQPYISLWKGHSPAEQSLLLDYIHLGPFLAIFHAMHYKHRLVFWSSVTAIVTFIFQSLTGSIFQLRQQERVDLTSVTSTSTIGLIQDFDQLNAFVAAAGFTQAAAFRNLSDPPFINTGSSSGGWSVAQFILPSDYGLNGTLTLNTTAIQTVANCANPTQTNLNQETFVLTSTSVDGCVVSVEYDPTASEWQYGVQNVSCPGNAATLDTSYQPVMFWYLQNQTNGAPDVQTVFCSPSIQAFDVTASIQLDDDSLYNVEPQNQYVPNNNVTSSPPFNGLIFPDNTNTFIQARAVAIRSGVPAAIFQQASQQPGGLQTTFNLPNGFLDITQDVYTQYLSIVAGFVYFVGTNTPLTAQVTSLTPILWIDPLPGHTLAILLILVGFAGFIIQILHQRERRQVLLTCPPGSIAAVLSKTALSGFGELLLPYDDEVTLERKLSGLRFRLDRRTGAIVVDDDTHMPGLDDAMISLLRSSHNLRNSATSESSSMTVHQADSGYSSLRTPYDP